MSGNRHCRDELAAGLNPAELDWIAGRIKVLAATGMAVIVVEHLVGFIEHNRPRHRAHAGKEIFEGKLAAAVKEPQGIEVVFLEVRMPPDTAPLLDAKGIDAGYGTMHVLWVSISTSARVRRCCCWVPTAGKTTFLKSLVGLIEARRGHIKLRGDDVTRMRSSDRMRLGMTNMSELAVFPDRSIKENIRVGAETRPQVSPAISARCRASQKRLAAEPRLLMIEEPSARLSRCSSRKSVS
jgi:ABC-type branched-subunit amino acid transport system ATPase component